VNVVGTTGAGDCTIAGFLAGMLKGLSLEAALRGAVAVGACNVEQADAVSGIPPWDSVQGRLTAGWKTRETTLELDGWHYDSNESLWMKS
jgi:sugar/nucleoside kinase (ribokinase family)